MWELLSSNIVDMFFTAISQFVITRDFLIRYTRKNRGWTHLQVK